MIQSAINVVEELTTFINHELLEGDESGLETSTPLLELGILDSLAMVSLLAFVENQFGVHVPDEDVTPENFENLQTIGALVKKLQAEKPVSSGETGNSDLLDTIRILEASGIQRQLVELDSGEQMHVLKVSGNQPTWVLLPGVGNPSSSWGTMLRSLMDENEAIAVDLAGFGLSCSGKEKPNYFDHLQSTIELLDKIAKPPFLLLGSSAGAMIAAEIARQRPESVHALVVTGFGLIEDVDAWWQRLMSLSESPERFLEAAYYRPPKLTAALQRLIDDVLKRPAYRSFLDGGGFAAMKTAFDDLRVPTLFVAGENDDIIPKSAVTAAVERVPGAQLDWLARCGHFPSAEQPEELLYVIRNFLKSLN